MRRGLAVLVLAAASGCASHTAAPVATLSGLETYDAAPEFEYTVPGPVTLSAPLDTARHHDVLALSFESAGDIGTPGSRVEAHCFRSRSPGAGKLVVVLPIWGTSRYPHDGRRALRRLVRELRRPRRRGPRARHEQVRHRSAFYSLTPLGLNFSRRRIYRFLDRVL